LGKTGWRPKNPKFRACCGQWLWKDRNCQSPSAGTFLKNGLLLAGGALAGAGLSRDAAAAESNLPPNIPPWTRSLGFGVLTNLYGKPS